MIWVDRNLKSQEEWYNKNISNHPYFLLSCLSIYISAYVSVLFPFIPFSLSAFYEILSLHFSLHYFSLLICSSITSSISLSSSPSFPLYLSLAILHSLSLFFSFILSFFHTFSPSSLHSLSVLSSFISQPDALKGSLTITMRDVKPTFFFGKNQLFFSFFFL